MLHEQESRLLREVMSHYGAQYQPRQAARVENAGFSGARIWRLTSPAGDFALRQWPRGSLEAERLLGLHRLLRHVHAQGITNVAVPVTSLQDSTLVDCRDRLWQLEPWLPGRADYVLAPSPARLSVAMSALAEWHQAAATFVPTAEERRWFAVQPSAPSPGLAERLKRLQSWNPARLQQAERACAALSRVDLRETARSILSGFRTAAPVIEAELRIVAGQRFRLQPCLRDIWHDHVLFSGETVTGLIDASACRAETVAGDLARLLGSLVGDDRNAWNTALDAYQASCPLSAEELVAVKVFDRSGVVLSGMTWIERLNEDLPETINLHRVAARMADILHRLQRLGKGIP